MTQPPGPGNPPEKPVVGHQALGLPDRPKPLGWHVVPIYYEDTDFSGFVYHAQYLKFFERAREQLFGIAWLRSLYESGFHFAVHELQLAYQKPAHHGNTLLVSTFISWQSRRPSLIFTQVAELMQPTVVNREQLELGRVALTPCAKAEISVVFLNRENRPTRLTPDVEQRLLSLEGNGKPIVSGEISVPTHQNHI